MFDWLRRAAVGLCAAAAVAPLAECAEVDYLRDVKPIFHQRCIACHGALQQQSGLRLDAGSLILRGGDGGPVVTAGDVDRSSLLERVSASDIDLRMPPEGEPLSDAQLQTLRAWIGQGARYPDDERPEEDPRRHWAFQVLRRPAVPAPAGPSAAAGHPISGHPIDAFLAARLADSHLAPQPAASRGLLLRRVYLDLIGLPPSRDELRAFLADPAPDAYQRVVDRLLASPRYGERWGRHWMDVWRYSDWYGRRMVPDVWNSAPQIWRWRDWIVRSLNDDRGYDQMVAEMLAGDEVAPDDDQAGYATGYLVRNWYALNPNDWMRSNVEHTGKAFLGLTLNCAHCHDHKYDPITQDDYFRFRAFFEPIGIRQDRVPGEADPGPFQEYQYSTLRKIVRLGAVRIFDKTPDAPTWFYTGGDERNRVAERGSIAAGVPRFLEHTTLDLEPVSLPLTAWNPSLRPAIQETLQAEQQERVSAAQRQLADVRSAADGRLPELRRTLDEAEDEFQRAVELAPADQRPGPLTGRQALLLRAEQGRCLVQNRLRGLRQLPSGTTIRFQLRIVRDAHVNFQLAKDLEQGLTAGYVSFETGVIKSYQPGSFTEFEVGRYDLAGGQAHFEVSLELQPAEDRCRLTIRVPGDPPVVLVDHVPVALNGWNPVENPRQAVTFDARTGSVALIDELSVEAPPATGDAATAGKAAWVTIGFEPPEYAPGADVVGIAGWESSRFSQAPATARVSAAWDLAPPSPESLRVQSARRAVELEELRIAAAEAQLAAAVAQQASVAERIAAELARHDPAHAPGAARQLALAAARQEREANRLQAEAQLLDRQRLLAEAEQLPESDADRAKKVEEAGKQLAAAQAAAEKTRQTNAQAADSSDFTPLGPSYPPTSTGRRHALARWITSRDNPLTARVAVNHIWMRHFHAPLVGTVFDFGRNGQRPTHPELLDWLAVELIDSGWSMKHLHRLIVTSQAYRMRSGGPPDEAARRDPENRLLWRMNVGRLEAELVRDSLLHVAGRLDLRLGGQELENSEAASGRRRSLYYSCHPELDGKSQLGALFDAAEATECYRRTRSVVPQQALALTNSQLVHEVSRDVAAALWQAVSAERTQAAEPGLVSTTETSPASGTESAGDERAFVVAAFEHLLSRQPSEAELAACLEYLAAGTDPTTGPAADSGRESLVRVLLNHNDFLAIR